MDSQSLLSILKFTLPVVGFISVILSQLKSIRHEGPDGERRLTFYGRVLTGLTVLSAFISLFSAGFEAILKRSDEAREREKEQKVQIDAIRGAQIAKEEKDRERAKEQAFRDKTAAAARKLEAGQVDQKLAILAEAANAQRRAAIISHRLDAASAARLADAQAALAEFGRINYPLRKIEITIEIEFNIAGVEAEKYWDALVKQKFVPFVRKGHETDPNYSFPLGRIDSRNRSFYYGANGNNIALTFYEPATISGRALPNRRGHDALQTIARPSNTAASFAIELGVPELRADLVRRVITGSWHKVVEPERAGEFGDAKLSMADAARLIPVLSIRRGGAEIMPRGPDRITSINMSFNDDRRFSFHGQASVSDAPLAFILH